MAMQDVLDAALRLSEDERRELAERLFESLHDVAEDGAEAKFEYEAEWTAEIDRRVTEIREGRAKLIDGPETIARMREIVESARRSG
jgi:putative addiction module component (TIGR02574 family)